MSLLWNQRILPGPAVNTKLQRSALLDLSGLRTTLEKAIATFSTLNFAEIGALASRLIAKRCHSFRSQYGFKILRKTNVAICRLNNINITAIIENFYGSLPNYKVQGKSPLPTRDNFDFILIRLQSLSKLLARIAVCAKDAATFFLKYVNRNFFLETCVFYIGLLAQVWSLAREFCGHTIVFYRHLYPYRRHFHNNQNKWLPDDCELPETLDDFLDDWDLNLELDNLKEQCPIELHKEEDDKKEIEGPTHVVRMMRKVPMSTPQHKQLMNRITSNAMPKETVKKEMDIGMSISRETMAEQFTIEIIKTVDDIQRFVRKESELRDQRAHQLTAGLTEKQWKELQTKINMILVSSQGRNCMKNFRKLWRHSIEC